MPLHPDYIKEMEICKNLPLDEDIKSIINSGYIDTNTLLLCQIIRRLPPQE